MRVARAQATAESVVWVVDRFTFRRILTNVSDEQIKEYHQFLKKVDLLAVLSSREREKVAEALEEVHYAAGETIVKQASGRGCHHPGAGAGETHATTCCRGAGREG